MEFTLLGAAFVAVGAVYATLWWEAKRGNAADCTADLWDLAIAGIVTGLVVGRLAAMVRSGVNPLTSPGDMIIIRSGVDTGFAAIGAAAAIAWLGRRELSAVADGLAVSLLAGLAGWHGGCMIRETCLGTPTDLPWAMTLPGSTTGRHPVELYAALLFSVATLGLVWLRRRRMPPWSASSLALGSTGLIRLVTEPLRPSLDGGPIGWYVAAVVAGIAGILFAPRIWSQIRPPDGPA